MNKDTAWKEYPSIDNANRRLFKKVPAKEGEDKKWVALEKVHGSNFCFISNGSELSAARRNALLDPVETFYSWQLIRDKYEEAFHSLYRLVVEQHADVAHICIYGELFGGAYPHPEVLDLGRQPVQKGIYYSPDIHFYVFDLQLVRGSGTREWFHFHQASALFDACGLFRARALVEGTLEECFAFDIRCNSTVPALLGLPPLAQNQMEGIVIRAVETVTINKQRAIFKKKNAKFEEVNPRCETEWEKQRRLKKEAIEQVYDEFDRYLNPNRLHSLESKIGPVTRQNLLDATPLLAADALKDLIQDNEETWARIEDAAQEVVRKNVKSKAGQWLDAWLTSQEQEGN